MPLAMPPAVQSAVPADGAAVDDHGAPTVVDAAAKSSWTASVMIPFKGAIVDRHFAPVVEKAGAAGIAPAQPISADGAIVYRQRSRTEANAPQTIADRQPCEGDMSNRVIANVDHTAACLAVNNGRGSVGADQVQANVDSEILLIDGVGNQDGISRRSQRDGMSDSLAGPLARLAVVAVTPVCAIDIPCVAGQGGGA